MVFLLKFSLALALSVALAHWVIIPASAARSDQAMNAASADLVFVLPDQPVPGPPKDRPLFEPHLAASPVDPAHLLGTAIIAEPGTVFGPNQSCVAVVTFDAGRTWRSHTFDLTHCGDPWVAIGGGGEAWFSALGRRPGTVAHRMYLYRSVDGGRTWDEQVADFGGGHDHQTLVVSPATPGKPSALYVVSSQGRRTDVANFHAFIARSIDGARSWQPPLVTTPSNLSFTTLAGGVLPDGTVLVPFIDSQRPGANGMLARRRAWVYRTQADLSAISPPLLISEACTSNSGFGSLFTLPESTRALFVCVNAAQSVVVHTSDGGAIWSDPVAIEGSAGAIQRVPAGVATSSGVIGLSWMDSRQAPAECFVLRASVSTDGGRSFSPSRPLATAASCPQSEANGAAGKRWRHGGDYSGFAATADGRFHALWADSRGGLSQLRFTTVALH